MSSQYGDPYEEWKALGRPGGSFEAWQASQGGQVPPDVSGAPVSTPQPTPGAAPTASSPDAAYIAEVRGSGQGKSEDYTRFSDAELLSWRKYYQGGGKFRNDYGDIVDKPDERGPNTPGNRNGTGDQGDYGRGWNTAGLDSQTAAPLMAPAAPAAAPAAPAAAPDPLQPLMAPLQGQTPPAALSSFAPPSVSPFTAGLGLPNVGATSQTSTLPNLLAPLNAPTQPQQGGLTNMLNPLQRNRRPNAWF